MALRHSDIPFFYGREKLASISCAVVAWDTVLKGRSFAFLDRTWRHDTHIKLREDRQLPRKHYISEKVLESLPIDPCHVAILIAMAQDMYQNNGNDISQARVRLCIQNRN
jgi:hypothetical protein